MKITKFLIGSALICAAFASVFYWMQRAGDPAASFSQVRFPDSMPKKNPAQEAPAAVRDLSSVTKGEQSSSRQPKSQLRWEEFLKKSEGKWKVKKNDAGAITKLSEGSFPLGTRAAVVGAERFLKEYGPSLFALDLEGLQLKQNNQEEHATQLVYEQSIAGYPVFGSRLNMFIDREGNLVHVASDLYSGPRPSVKAVINPLEAARVVRAALIERLENQYGAVSPDAYPDSEIERAGVLGYRLFRNSISFVYRYRLVLDGDHSGDFDILVDATQGQVVMFKDLSRK